MSKITLKIYHNANGSTDVVTKIKALAEERNIGSVEFNILEDKFTATRLLQICNKMNLNLADIVDETKEFYKENLKNSNFDQADWVRILIENPQLIKTPIVETKEQAKIIQNPREILSLSPIGQNIDGYNHK